VANVPGCSRDDVTIQVDDGVLTLRATPRSPRTAGHRTLHEGLADSIAERRFSLPDVIDAEHITAPVRDGILRLTLPKRAAANPRRIPVS